MSLKPQPYPDLTALARGYGYADPAEHPARDAAQIIVPLLRERLGFQSVLDVGCGVGIWLMEFQNQGAIEILGLDGEWVPKDKLLIPENAFRVHNFKTPIRLERKFDLVLSLEVAEHIPEKFANDFVESLTAHGDTIVFSAAVPGQGGFQHVNEQLQDHWITRFGKLGFRAYDVIRPAIWSNPRVPFYYAQNILVFSRRPLPFPTEFITSPIHPELFGRRTDPRNYSLRAVIRNFPSYVARYGRGLFHR